LNDRGPILSSLDFSRLPTLASVVRSILFHLRHGLAEHD
jgi:hypothetical protein